MADKLKYFFDETLIRSLARDLGSVERRFDQPSFVAACMAELPKLELTARAAHVATVMYEHLPRDFELAAATLLRSLGPELARSDVFGMAPFRYLPHVMFVARYGLDHFDTSMRVQYELTKRFSAESSIRAFLVKYPEQTYAQLSRWAVDPNVHVRRLVSEGTRPRLPWAPRLRAFVADPSPVLALLERLKDDPERYVQRSVANNLNDIAKDHPELAVEVCRRWSVAASPERQRLVRHALRSLVKQGHRGALQALGVASTAKVEVRDASFEPRRVMLGATARFSCALLSTTARRQELLVDYAVHFVKADGKPRAKVFKLRKLSLPGQASVELSGRLSFADMTTRKHYPGAHKVELLINGVTFALGEVEVCATRSKSKKA